MSLIRCNSEDSHSIDRGCQKGKTGNWLAFFNTLNSTTGVGIFAMPFVLQEAGLVPGVCIFVFLMFASARCCVRLVKAVVKLYEDGFSPLKDNEHKHMNYPQAAYLALGEWGKWIAVVGLVIGNFGTCVAYLVFIKENLVRFFSGVFNCTANTEEIYWILALSPLIFILTRLKDMTWLAPVSVLSIIALVGVVLLVSTDAISKFKADVLSSLLSETVNWDTSWVAIGITSFMNEGMIGAALPIRKSMKHPENYPFALSTAMGIFVITYILFAFACLLLFFPSVSSQITLDFPHTALYEVLIVVACITVAFTYPMVMYVVRTIIKGESSFCARQPLYLDLLLFCAVISLAGFVDRFGGFLAIVGALGNSIVIYVIPNMMYLVVFKPTSCEKCECIVYIILGFVTMCFGVYSALLSLVNGGY